MHFLTSTREGLVFVAALQVLIDAAVGRIPAPSMKSSGPAGAHRPLDPALVDAFGDLSASLIVSADHAEFIAERIGRLTP